MKASVNSTLDNLKQRRLIWNAGHARDIVEEQNCLASGYNELDQALGGWPASGLVELQAEQMGIGELRLLLPVLGTLAQSEREHKLQVFLGAPFALMPQGLGDAFSEHLVVLDETKHECKLWALEQLFRSGVCSVIVFWINGLKPAQAKRLQIAAKESKTLGFMLSYDSRVCDSLPISLRMQLSVSEQGLQVNVFKRQNAFPLPPFEVNFQGHFPEFFEHKIQPAMHAYRHNIVSFPKPLETERV